MRYAFIALWMLSWSVTPAVAQVSVGIGLPGVSIGINLPLFPELVPVPGYPVYYAPGVSSNYFFYDGMYWAYERENWYASSWYDGPWGVVAPDVVPVYLLRVPVRYYRQPPEYFRGWQANAPPRWGEHWGREWEEHRRGWDRWNRSSAPARAPLPVYQRQYAGDRYPQVEQQQALRDREYRYEPRDPVVRQRYQEESTQRAFTPQRGQQVPPRERGPEQQDIGHANPPPPIQHQAAPAPRSQPPPRDGEGVQRSAPTNAPPPERGRAMQDQGRGQQPPPRAQQDAVQHEPQSPRSSQQDHSPQRGQRPIQDQGRGQQPPPHAQRGAVQHEQQSPTASQQDHPQGRGATQGQGQGKGHQKPQEHGRGDEG
jgi:hypothetical protein